MAYEILWKDQTYRINKNEKWTKISRSKLIAYLKAKYPDPAEREMKELSLALGHEVETNTFKCRNAELVGAKNQLLDAEKLGNFLIWETSPWAPLIEALFERGPVYPGKIIPDSKIKRGVSYTTAFLTQLGHTDKTLEEDGFVYDAYHDTWKIPEGAGALAGPKWTKTNEQITRTKDEWPPIGYKHGDWELVEYDYAMGIGKMDKTAALWASINSPHRSCFWRTVSPEQRPNLI